jgi:hypothetical protein
MTDMFEGIIIFIFALLLFFAIVALIVLLYVFDRKIRDRLIEIVCSIAVGLSLCYVGWMLALLWIYFRMLGKSGGSNIGGISSSFSVWPGPGTIMPPLLGLGAAGCLAVVLMQRRQQMWLGIAAGGGLFLGLILFAADAQPWANPPFLGLQAKMSSSFGGTVTISP